MGYLTDSHCHFHPELTRHELDKFIDILNNGHTFKEKSLHLMTTQHIDLQYIDILLTNLMDAKFIIVPYFGIHPWFSHLFTLHHIDKQDHYRNVLKPQPNKELLEKLPEPILLDDHVAKIKQIIAKHELDVFGFGEIGLDKLFKIPNNGYLGNLNYLNDLNDGSSKLLSSSKVIISHQIEVMNKFLTLATEFNKPVSLHCVKAHGPLYDNVIKYKDLTVLLHSYTGSIDQAKIWIKNKSNLYFSLSNWINGEKEELLKQLLEIVKPSQIVTESDIYIDKLFIQGKNQEYFNHLQGIFDKLNSYINIDVDQLHKNMLKSIKL
ncbi:unnamed protein product [Candida verbasci]|uniref:Uncharacterized protein n=1 Tax=Candida verbasci TaxID=1227364 RepID=A0A9W4XLL9_9ASCO|nr:unnamed protein product [Candida verbasci]